MDPNVIAEHQAACTETRARYQQHGLTGEWDNEPDRIEWTYKGMPCLMLRNPQMLSWCGYVGVPRWHVLYGKDYDTAHALADLNVHGGLTYSDKCRGFICHPSKEKVWWLGFDCAHAGDIVPGCEFAAKLTNLPSKLEVFGWKDHYRNVEYVKSEVNELAEQLYGVKRYEIYAAVCNRFFTGLVSRWVSWVHRRFKNKKPANLHGR